MTVKQLMQKLKDMPDGVILSVILEQAAGGKEMADGSEKEGSGGPVRT